MGPKDATPVGLDNGYNNIKTVIGAAAAKQNITPSVVAPMDPTLAINKSYKPSYEDETGIYLVGRDAIMYGDPQLPNLDSTKFKTNEYRIQTLYALEQAGVRDADIVCGTSVKYYRLNRSELERTMCNWSNDRVKIHRVRAIPEPVGTATDYMFDYDGKLVNSLEGKTIGIADVGGNTIDIVEMIDGRLTQRYKALNEGIFRVYHRLHVALSSKYPTTKFNLYQMDKVVENKVVSIFGKDVDVERLVAESMRDFVKTISLAIEELWGGAGQLHQIILTGGAAPLIEGELKKTFPHVLVPENPVLANARGFYKYCMLHR